jgi:hypothetical protein
MVGTTWQWPLSLEVGAVLTVSSSAVLLPVVGGRPGLSVVETMCCEALQELQRDLSPFAKQQTLAADAELLG